MQAFSFWECPEPPFLPEIIPNDIKLSENLYPDRVYVGFRSGCLRIIYNVTYVN